VAPPLAGRSGAKVAVPLTWIEMLVLSIVLRAAASVVVLGPGARVEVLQAKASRKIIHGWSLVTACVLCLGSIGAALHA
jgi:hypothetical protein